MSLDSLRIYQTAAKVSDEISKLVSGWNDFHKTTLGSQIVRAADSIGNNISEGYGRVSTGERIQFFMYADGSISEVRNCLARAAERGLIERTNADSLIDALRSLSIQLVEFSYAILQRDTEYSGPFRERIARRRAWRSNR
ncbi:MAG TPA: four helix bundle protein [Candidatus Didemnitutus sp.]|nr:four helix bundle protein [Candidatus Didemnitutus sp.]